MADRIQIRRDTAANWTSVNPILSQGEIAYELDTGKLKIGDGTTAWNSLPYKFVVITDHTALTNIGTNTHAQIDSHISNTSNPHSVTKAQVGLGNVDNTSDLNKPISTATQAALNLKYDASNPSGYQTAAQVSSTVSAASITDRDRANHTGTQLASTISDFTEAAQDATLGVIADSSSVDFTYNDASNTLTASVIPAGVNHNSLQNYVANQHVDHSTVNVNAGTSLNGGGDITATRTINHNNFGTAGTYGSASSVPVLTTEPTGHVTGVTNTPIVLPQSQVTNLTTDLAAKANLAGGNTITGTQNFSGGTIIFDAGGETRFGIGGYTDPDVGTQYNIKYGGAGRSMAVRGISYFLDQMGIGAQTPNASAKLEIASTTQGFLMPRMTTTERLAIASPAQGLQVYDTSLNTICTFDGSEWVFELWYVVQNNQGTSSTTYANVTELVTPSLPIGRYAFEFYGACQSTLTTNGVGLRLGESGATISALNATWSLSQAANGTDKDYEYAQLSATTNVTSASVLTANADFPCLGSGVFSLSAAGSVAVQIRSENALVTCSIRINSVLRIRKITG